MHPFRLKITFENEMVVKRIKTAIVNVLNNPITEFWKLSFEMLKIE